ncbi:hypothetical protein [Streptomyces botrytidirepellens]|uniref:Uncharacterized protein n=1 Tax=Streptomyces botrytidirepellens TaxID=2486417 RepID=A0A3M8TAP8_9ACTN|nr:hypothetical protein [Streptomyces botrytidirepellens]RNF87762.1 hypothetical protein EEJ42_41880 [Streptomyces botrytidirepellens]
MEIELLPHAGVASFRLGMSFDEAMAVARQWDGVTPSPAEERPPGKFIVRNEELTFRLILNFREDEYLNSIVVRRFKDEDADVHVLLEGLDVFRTQPEELQEQLEQRGHTVEENDLGYDTVPDLNIIFSNESSYEYPVDEEGDPLYYDSVLIADRITY